MCLQKADHAALDVIIFDGASEKKWLQLPNSLKMSYSTQKLVSLESEFKLMTQLKAQFVLSSHELLLLLYVGIQIIDYCFNTKI